LFEVVTEFVLVLDLDLDLDLVLDLDFVFELHLCSLTFLLALFLPLLDFCPKEMTGLPQAG
jgi:hypothetical protein